MMTLLKALSEVEEHNDATPGKRQITAEPAKPHVTALEAGGCCRSDRIITPPQS